MKTEGTEKVINQHTTKGDAMSKLKFDEEVGEVIDSETGLTVASMLDEDSDQYIANTDWDKTVRYGKLFAASPDLLEALETALHYLSDSAPAPVRYEIEAAIAKAKAKA